MPSAAEECREPSGKCRNVTLSGDWSPCSTATNFSLKQSSKGPPGVAVGDSRLSCRVVRDVTGSAFWVNLE